MNRLFALLSFCSLLFLIPFTLQAQHTDQHLGFRIGTESGISFRSLNHDGAGIEGILVYRKGGLRAIGMLIQQVSFDRQASMYLGLGGHAGYNGLILETRSVQPALGFDAVFGLEYAFSGVPFSLSLEYKPILETWEGFTFSGNSGAFTLRYLIN